MNYVAMQTRTAKKIKAVGVPVILYKRTVSTYNPGTSTEVLTNNPDPGYFLETSQEVVDEKQTRLYSPTHHGLLAGCVNRASPGDTIQIAGINYGITVVKPTVPNGIIIVQQIEFRN